MAGVFHSALSGFQRELATARLPTMVPVEEADWLRQDEVWAEQIAAKAALISARRGDIIAACPGSEAAQGELLDLVLGWLSGRAGVRVGAEAVGMPWGRVPVLREDPLLTLSRLVQEDLCLLERQGEEHVLTAAVLGFPSGWTLAEKIGKPLMRIHRPVAPYDADIGLRVQRMFDRVPVGRILGRANLHGEPEGDLWMARSETEPKPDRRSPRYERSEWQTVRRLPRTGAIVFTIHVSVVPVSGDPGDARRADQGEKPD